MDDIEKLLDKIRQIQNAGRVEFIELDEAEVDYIADFIDIKKKQDKIEVSPDAFELAKKLGKIYTNKHQLVGCYVCGAIDLLENENKIDEKTIDDPILIEMLGFLLVLQKIYPDILEIIPTTERSRKATTMAFDGWMLRSAMLDPTLIKLWPFDLDALKEVYSKTFKSSD